MKIDQLEPGTILNFLVDISGEKMTLESHIQEVIPKKRLVLADPIFENDKIVSFKGANIAVDVLAVFIDDKPQIFKDAVITTMRKSDGSLCYNLACQNESKVYNRRGSYRCFVGIDASLQSGPGVDPIAVVIKDVSTSGFSFTGANTVELSPGQLVHLVLNDYFPETDENYTFNLFGNVCRTQVLENGKKVYGCKLNSRVVGLENYIAKKDRMGISNRNSSAKPKK